MIRPLELGAVVVIHSTSKINIFMTNVGLDTLSLRMEHACENASALAEFCSAIDGVDVNYPGLSGNRFREIAARQFGNRFGTMFTLRFGSKARAFEFLNSLQFALKASNIGDVRTPAIHPESTIYCNATDDEKSFAGVFDDLIRVNVGIENIDDLIGDFDRALKKIRAEQ